METKARMQWLAAEKKVQQMVLKGTTTELCVAMDARDAAFRVLQNWSGVSGAVRRHAIGVVL